jgi:hypothetical protein
MADKTEHTTKDLEADVNPDIMDEAAIALKHVATRDMAPITEGENHQILKKIDLWLMPIVISLLKNTKSRWSLLMRFNITTKVSSTKLRYLDF